jgi:hypothetical protein
VLLVDAAFFLDLSFFPFFFFDLPLIEKKRVRNPMSEARTCVSQVASWLFALGFKTVGIPLNLVI